MPKIRMPNGDVVNFPDDMPKDEIKRLIATKFPELGGGQEDELTKLGREPSPEMQTGLDEMSAMTQNPSKAKFDALPAWQKPLVAAHDIGGLMAGGAASMVGLNLDKGAAMVRSGLGLGSYEDELAEQQRMTNAARKRSGMAGTAAELTGAVALPLGLAGKGLTLAGRGGTAAMTGAKGLAARSGLMAAEGAGYGALSAHANDQDMGTGALIGAAGGAAGNVIGEGISAGVGKVAGMFNKKTPVPKLADLKAKTDAAFGRARNEGVVFTKTALDDFENNINTFLTKRGYVDRNQPGVKGGLDLLKDYKDRGGNVTLEGLQSLRETFSGGYIGGANTNAKNNSMIREAINLIDDMIENPKAGHVFASGDKTKAAAAFKEGMKASRNQHKLEDLEYLIEKGRRQGDRNILDNAPKRIKTLLSDKLLDPRSPMARGWTDVEKEAIKKASTYTKGERLAHAASGMAPQGKLTGAAQAGSLLYTIPAALAGNPIPLAIQGGSVALGMGSKAVVDNIAKKSVTELTRLIANGGVPPEVIENVVQRLAHSKREALTRSLMAIGVSLGTQAPAQQ